MFFDVVDLLPDTKRSIKHILSFQDDLTKLNNIINILIGIQEVSTIVTNKNYTGDYSGW